MKTTAKLKTLIVSMLMAGAGMAQGNQPDADADVQAIEQLYANWRVAVETSDIPGYVAGLHPKVRMLPPGAPAVQDASSYADFLQPVFAAATYKIEVESYPQVTVTGDLAVAEYVYTIVLTLKDPKQAVSEPGALTANRTTSRYMDVLRRTEDGWRVWRHTWHSY